MTKAVVLAACDPTKDRRCAGHIWVAAYRTNGFAVCNSLANLRGECFSEDGWAAVGFLRICHSPIIEIAGLIWVPSRPYECLKVTDCDTQFQILIHAQTRFAHPAVVYSLRMTNNKKIVLFGIKKGAKIGFRIWIWIAWVLGIHHLRNLRMTNNKKTVLFGIIKGAKIGFRISIWIALISVTFWAFRGRGRGEDFFYTVIGLSTVFTLYGAALGGLIPIWIIVLRAIKQAINQL